MQYLKLTKGRVKKRKEKKELAFDQKGGGVSEKTNLLILFFIFLQTINMASRLLDSLENSQNKPY